MGWLQISVVTTAEFAPKLADMFSDLGSVSVTYMDAENEPVYEPALGETKIWPQTQVIALYELSADSAKIKHEVLKHYPEGSLRRWSFDLIEDQAWERAWLEHYRPMKFADRLWVCPSGQEQDEDGTVCLTLDPGLAFGTGTHPTTALCLEWLAQNELAGKTVIDYGCGSGILGIAAVLLGAERAYAVDIDPQALTATQYNAEKNDVQGKIKTQLVDEFADKPVQANAVLANILANPLIFMAKSLSGLVLPKGHLVLSGILADQAEEVMVAYRPFINVNSCDQREDWVRLACLKD